MPGARRTRGGGRRAVSRRLPLHPRDLVDALYYPQSGLANSIRWPSDWNHPYRFGWFMDPCTNSQEWWHLDMDQLYRPTNWERGSTPGSWRPLAGRNPMFLEGWASAHTRDSVKRTCRRLLEIKRGQLYESGFRCRERIAEHNPEEDITTAFEQYHTNRGHLASSYPKRYQLLSAYFRWPR